MNGLQVTVGPQKTIKDGQDVPSVINHASKNIAKLRIPFRLALPLRQDHRGHFYVPPQLVRGMAAQEQAVQKGPLALREVEIMHDFGRNELWHRHHGEPCTLLKTRPAS